VHLLSLAALLERWLSFLRRHITADASREQLVFGDSIATGIELFEPAALRWLYD
jgi:hypothetical protein